MADNLQVSSNISKDANSVNILTLSVVRRDGGITPFKSDKISNAIKKAFLAQTKIRNDKNKEKEQQDSIHKTVEALSHKVVSALTRRIADGDMVHIEDIQDQVELALMRDEHHKVARAYVLYREQRAASRYHTKKLKEEVGEKASSMMVTKRDGSKEPISLDKITNSFVNKVSNNLRRFTYNKIIANFYEIYSELSSVLEKKYSSETIIENYKKILICMIPVIPHFANECISLLNLDTKLKWPKINEDLLVEEKINYVIQINGKKRGLITTNRDISENDLIKLVNTNVELNKYIKNQEFKKKIFVPNKLINIII